MPRALALFAALVLTPISALAQGAFSLTSPDVAAGAAGKLPAGAAQSPTSFGMPGYGGPCPPAGDRPHRYVFTLYALSAEKVDLQPNATQALAGFTINASKVATASFTAMFGR